MGYARKSLISLRDTPYYHVVARCLSNLTKVRCKGSVSSTSCSRWLYERCAMSNSGSRLGTEVNCADAVGTFGQVNSPWTVTDFRARSRSRDRGSLRGREVLPQKRQHPLRKPPIVCPGPIERIPAILLSLMFDT